MPLTSRTSWRAKLEKDQQRRIVPMPARMQKRLGKGTLLIPTPLDVDAAIRSTPAGRLVTTGDLRRQLAEKFGATTACPLCTGMFVRIAAEAAEEGARRGQERPTPWWRVVGAKGELNPKLPGGGKTQAKRLREEGHAVRAGRVTLAPA